MVVNSVDRERVNVGTRRTENDEASFLVGNIAGYWANMALSNDGANSTRTYKTPSDAVTYQVLQYGHAIMLMGFGLAYGYGVADALWKLTAQPFDEDHARWQQWWTAEGEKFQVVQPAVWPGTSARPTGIGGSRSTGPRTPR